MVTASVKRKLSTAAKDAFPKKGSAVVPASKKFEMIDKNVLTANSDAIEKQRYSEKAVGGFYGLMVCKYSQSAECLLQEPISGGIQPPYKANTKRSVYSAQ